MSKIYRTRDYIFSDIQSAVSDCLGTVDSILKDVAKELGNTCEACKYCGVSYGENGHCHLYCNRYDKCVNSSDSCECANELVIENINNDSRKKHKEKRRRWRRFNELTEFEKIEVRQGQMLIVGGILTFIVHLVSQGVF